MAEASQKTKLIRRLKRELKTLRRERDQARIIAGALQEELKKREDSTVDEVLDTSRPRRSVTDQLAEASPENA